MTPAAPAETLARSPSRPVIPDVLAEHLEEHGFLCLQRRRLIFSTELPLRRLPAHDERIAAHWDGLVIGGSETVALALERLEGEQPWELASAARAWLELGKPSAADVAGKLAAQAPEKSASWREAFRQCPAEVAMAALPQASLAALPPHARAVALDALAWHGALPAELADQALRSSDAGIRAALGRALPHARLADATPFLRKLLDDPSPAVARRALWSAALLEPASALERARRAARGATPDAFAIRLLGLAGGLEDHALIVEAAGTDHGLLPAIRAFVDLGTEPAVESLMRLSSLSDKELAKLALDALEEAIGPIPRKDPKALATPEEARARWLAVREKLPRDARVLSGQPLPWRGEPREEPMCWIWRASFQRARAEAAWLRREVPDGFFDDLPAPDARPGE